MTRPTLTRDPLTGLPAVDELAGRVDQLQATAPGVLVARLRVDELDRTARAYGHGTRADLLAAVADRIHLHTDPLDGTAARLDEAEFAVVLPLPAGAAAYPLAWARHQLAVLRTRVTVPGHRLSGHTVPVTATLGAVLVLTTDGHRPLTELLTVAGHAAAVAAQPGGDALPLLLPGRLPAPAPYAAAERLLED